MFLQLLCAEGKSVSGSGGTAGFHWQTWAPAPSFLQGWLLLPEVAAGGRQRAAVCFSSVCRLNPAKAAACVRADARQPQLNAGIRVNTPRASRGSLQLSVREASPGAEECPLPAAHAIRGAAASSAQAGLLPRPGHGWRGQEVLGREHM